MREKRDGGEAQTRKRTRLLKTLKVERKVTLTAAAAVTHMHRYMLIFTQVQLMYCGNFYINV